MICIIGVGLFLSLGARLIQIRRFPYAIRPTLGPCQQKDASEGAIPPSRQSVLPLRLLYRTGNIAGVAGAIAIGGPGAVFWMWISAFLGMCAYFPAVTLAVHFRETNPDGDLAGGPMYYIKNGPGKKWMWLAYLFSIFGILTVFGTGNAAQVNASQRLSGLPSQATASYLTLLSVPLIWLWASFWLPLSLWCSLAASSASEV